MDRKDIEVVLDNIDDHIKLVFKLDANDVSIDLESDNSEEIKYVFLNIIEEIKKNPINLKYSIGENFDESKNKLFKDAADEYIEQLQTEIDTLENDDNLVEIRNS